MVARALRGSTVLQVGTKIPASDAAKFDIAQMCPARPAGGEMSAAVVAAPVDIPDDIGLLNPSSVPCPGRPDGAAYLLLCPVPVENAVSLSIATA